MFVSAIIFGLLGSFHCLGMCGPIAFMLPIDRSNIIKQIFQITSYHSGRLFTYSFIGFLFGLLGKGFYLFGFQQIVSIITGALMILIILLPNFFNKFKMSVWLQRMVLKVRNRLGKGLARKENETFFTIGFLNGFLPCGLVYMALLGAIAMGSSLDGSLYMFLFGLGTVPLMTTVIYFGSFSNHFWRKKVQQIIPFVVIFLGILFILRGLGLGIPFISPESSITVFAEKVIGCH